MMIKMLLEEAGQYFYCEARKTASHDYEGIVHFLHKVGDGNAFVRGKTHHIKTTFASRNDALTAAERHAKHHAMKRARGPVTCETERFAERGTHTAARTAPLSVEKAVC